MTLALAVLAEALVLAAEVVAERVRLALAFAALAEALAELAEALARLAFALATTRKAELRAEAGQLVGHFQVERAKEVLDLLLLVPDARVAVGALPDLLRLLVVVLAVVETEF